jgi:hypothetical protein
MLTSTLEVTQKHAIHPSNKCSMCVMTLSNHLCNEIWAMQKEEKKNKCMLKSMRKKRAKRKKEEEKR